MTLADVIGQRADCGWNLHKKLYSIRKNGKVVGYSPTVTMVDVTFVINERLLAKFHRSGVRTVHAWLRGTLTGLACVPLLNSETVCCSPLKYDGFVRQSDKSAVAGAKRVNLHYHPVSPHIEAAGIS